MKCRTTWVFSIVSTLHETTRDTALDGSLFSYKAAANPRTPTTPTIPAATAPVGLGAPPVEVLVEADAAAAEAADCELADSALPAEVVDVDPTAPEFDVDIEPLDDV